MSQQSTAAEAKKLPGACHLSCKKAPLQQPKAATAATETQWQFLNTFLSQLRFMSITRGYKINLSTSVKLSSVAYLPPYVNEVYLTGQNLT